MNKKLLTFALAMLTGMSLFAATAPASLSIKGSALKESSGAAISMKKVDNGFELYTAMVEGGQYEFEGDNLPGGTVDMVFGEEDLVPFRIRVDYSGDSPVVTVDEIDRVTMWTPWSKYTIAQLNYKGNGVFESTGGYAFIRHKWGDDRYRIKIFTISGSEETYGRLDLDNEVGVPDESTPQSYFDLGLLPGNDDWFDGANEFKIARQFQSGNSMFNIQLIMQVDGEYTHKQIKYDTEDPLPLDLTIEGSAVEGGNPIGMKQTSEGVFEYIGGLQNGEFKIHGTDLFTRQETYYSISGDERLNIGEDDLVTVVEGLDRLTPYYIRINTNARYAIFGRISELKIYQSYLGSADNTIILTYKGGQIFSGIGDDVAIPLAEYGPDDRYKFRMSLEDIEAYLEFGKNVENAGIWVTNETEDDYYKLYPCPDDDTDVYHYVYTWNRDIFGEDGDVITNIKMEVDFRKDYYLHRYEETLETGIADNVLGEGIKVYPTVVKDNLTIELEKEGFSADIISVAGMTLLSVQSTGNSATINTASLSEGIYLVRIIQDGKVEVKRIIKK